MRPELREAYPSISPRELVSSYGGSWSVVEPPKSFPLRPPRVFGHRSFDFEPRFGNIDGQLGEAGVLLAQGVRIAGPHGWPVAPEGELLLEMTACSALPEERLGARSFPLGEEHRLRGTLMSLCSDWANTNYAHFMLDGLARLDLIERSSLDLRAVDHILAAPFPGAHEWLRELGVPVSKLIWAEPGVDLVADNVILTSYPRVARMCPPWAAEFLRTRLGVEPREPRRGPPIFIARRAANRELRNAGQIEAIAADAGCRVVDPAPYKNPREELAAADVVIGPHGAGLTNLVFSRPGTRVLALLPSDELSPFFYTLSCAAGLEFGCLVGESEAMRPLDAWGPSPYDFVIDPVEFRDALAELLGTPH